MPATPDVHYARSGDVNVAYQVFGSGPLDIVMIPGWISHLEATWEVAEYRAWLERLASFARVITFDKRGTGMSDRASVETTLETRIDDLRAVMDAVGSERAAVIAWFEAAPMAVLFAATHPDRVRSLVLGDAFAKWTADADHPWGPDAAILDAVADSIAAGEWGRASALALFAPDAAADERFATWWARYERLSASPGAAADFMRMNNDVDVRDVLGSVRVPTLVTRRVGNPVVADEAARYVADHIEGARFVEIPGRDALPYYGDTSMVLDTMQEFLTGARPVAVDERILATVLFTDIVDSTARAAELGDRRWRALLDRHDSLVQDSVGQYRGRFVKQTGDGVLATFDGPARAVNCARSLCEQMGGLGVDLRAGLHAGEVELRGDDVGGIAVHIGARVGGLASPREVLVSRTVKDLVAGSDLVFEPRGQHTLKGVPDPWELFALVP